MNANRRGPEYRANVAARALAAVVGGYAVAAVAVFAGARLWPLDRLQATIAATMLAFLLVPAVAVFAFLAASPWRAWRGVVLTCAVLGVAGLLAGPRP